MTNMPGVEFDFSQPDSGDFNMDNFAGYEFDTGQYLDPHLQSSYASLPQYAESIRLSDLEARTITDNRAFGAFHSTEPTLQIDPNLTESKQASCQQMLAQQLTPPKSLSPEHFDAVNSGPDPSIGATAPRKSEHHKRKSANTNAGDTEAERRYKNRIAASKCRVKKKGREHMLMQEKDQKEYDNVKLKEEYSTLTQEALWYKNQLILHGNCGDASINQWLSNSAAKIVNSLGDRSVRLPDAPSNPVARPSAEHVYDRRDSGISTNSRASHRSSPTAGPPSPFESGFGRPVDQSSPQNVHDTPGQLKTDRDVNLLSGDPMRRSRSLDPSTLDTLASAAASRAKSVPVQQPISIKCSDTGYGGSIHQDPPVKAERLAAPPGVADSIPVVPWVAPQLSTAAVPIDPRLGGGKLPPSPLNTDAAYFDIPVQQDEQNSDHLLQTRGTKWMEA